MMVGCVVHHQGHLFARKQLVERREQSILNPLLKHFESKVQDNRLLIAWRGTCSMRIWKLKVSASYGQPTPQFLCLPPSCRKQ